MRIPPILETPPTWHIPWPLPSYAKVTDLGGGSYVYVLWDADGNAVYVGQTGSLRSRIMRHVRNKTFALIEAWQVNYADRMAVEADLIEVLDPAVYNDGSPRR